MCTDLELGGSGVAISIVRKNCTVVCGLLALKTVRMNYHMNVVMESDFAPFWCVFPRGRSQIWVSRLSTRGSTQVPAVHPVLRLPGTDLGSRLQTVTTQGSTTVLN